jgi:hypothetical protein
MRLEINGKIIATAIEVGEGWWEVTNWPRYYFRRNQAVGALTVTELLGAGGARSQRNHRSRAQPPTTR